MLQLKMKQNAKIIQACFHVWLAFCLIAPLTIHADPAKNNRSLYSAADSLQRGLALLGQTADGFQLAQELRERTGDGTVTGFDEALVKLGADRGVRAKLFGDLKPNDLSELPGPAILRVLPSVDSEHADHFILVERIEEDRAVISTSRVTSQAVPLLDLTPLWNGEAILLTSTAAEIESFIPSSTIGYLWPFGLALALGMVLFVTGLIWTSGRAQGGWSFRRAAMQALTLLVLVGIGASVYALSFANQRIQETRLDGEHVSQTFIDFRDEGSAITAHQSHDLTKEELSKIVNDGSFLWVDARTPKAYDKAHLDGALLLDRFDASTVRLRLAGIPLDTSIVVYCVDINCGRGRAASAALSKAGFTQVSHYPPGWAELKGWNQIREVNRD